MPSSYKGVEPTCISGVTGGSQELTVLEAEGSLTGNEWEKHPIVTGPEAPCILGIDYLRRGYFKDQKGTAAWETEEMKQLSTLPGLLEDPSVVGLLGVEQQQVPVATTTVHWQQYRVISKTCSPFNSPIWPVQKSNGGWTLTADYRGLNEVTPLLSAAVPDMLELQYELESRAAKWYATIDIANAFSSIPLAAECRPQFAFTWRGTALEQDEAPEHLQYTDDIILWGNIAEEGFEKGKKIVQVLLKACFVINQSKVKGPAQEIQFLGIKCWGEWPYLEPLAESTRGDSRVQAALQVVGTEAQLLLAPRLPVLGWMFKGRIPSTHHATDATWSKWVALITQWAQIGNPSQPEILEVIMDWPEGKDFGISPEEEMTCAEEAPLYNKLPENEKQYALFTDGSCCLVGRHRRWKAVVALVHPFNATQSIKITFVMMTVTRKADENPEPVSMSGADCRRPLSRGSMAFVMFRF
ncbi:hypothetical protein QYF61_010455 [Mycteria americana]|uniref:Uncharacterized protein n=1 Tax=Mycteria americana TaxID=33587 RepID=A0AAN7NQ87_MYCAM|nr:hypothetical protein QYF61_010455 [Mycteria americana]